MLSTREKMSQMGFDYKKMDSELQLEMIKNEIGISFLHRYFITKDKRFLALANLYFKKSKPQSGFIPFLIRKISDKSF